MSFKKLVSSTICTAMLCTAVSAQETKPNSGALPQQANASQGGVKMTSQGMVTPQQIAECLALDNQEEVMLAKFAREKSKNKGVVGFAKMIAEEHQSCLKKISKYAPEASRDGYLVENSTDSKSINGMTPAAATNPTTSSASIDMMQLQKEIAQQCISDSKKYLNTKDGEEFDKCFVGMQIAKHAAMHTKLVVLQRHTSGDMQQMVAEGIQATKKHMTAAENLMKQLDADDADTLADKNGK